MGKKSFYLGATGAAARMKLVVNMIMGAMMGAFCEVRGLACACVRDVQHEGWITKLVVNMIMGAMMGAFCEVRGLACACARVVVHMLTLGGWDMKLVVRGRLTRNAWVRMCGFASGSTRITT